MATLTVVIIGSIAVLIFWAVGAYNRLVRLKITIVESFGQIDVQLERRYDLIPNLMESAGKYLSHERETLEAVIAARHQAKSANDAARANPTNALAITTLAVSEQALSSRLHQFFSMYVAHPDLKGDKTIQGFGEALANTDNKFAFARQAFNDAVLDYNDARGQFPAVLIANLFSFAPSAVLQITETAEDCRAAGIAL